MMRSIFRRIQSQSRYAMKTLEAAFEAGADCLVLATQTGDVFHRKYDIVKAVKKAFDVKIGIRP